MILDSTVEGRTITLQYDHDSPYDDEIAEYLDLALGIKRDFDVIEIQCASEFKGFFNPGIVVIELR